MLSDFTLDTWVPNLRWMVAHRMQRKMPNCHLPRISVSLAARTCRNKILDFSSIRGKDQRGRNIRSMMPKLEKGGLVRNGSRKRFGEGPIYLDSVLDSRRKSCFQAHCGRVPAEPFRCAPAGACLELPTCCCCCWRRVARPTSSVLRPLPVVGSEFLLGGQLGLESWERPQ